VGLRWSSGSTWRDILSKAAAVGSHAPQNNWGMSTTDDHAVTFAAPEVILFSDDVERAAEFYKRLGFAETFRIPQEGAPVHVDLQLDDYKIGFASVDSARQDHGLNPVASRQRATITLWTQDTAKAYLALTALGIPGLMSSSSRLSNLAKLVIRASISDRG
jgi:hypothetical protein